MTLIETVASILCKNVTEEQAKKFALENYGELAAYIRQQFVERLNIKKNVILNNKLYK
jgi:hypothetical protein